ncbi:TPA: hypothetical protein I7C97_003139 [Vibrio cholerae]|nr:hypothetical protein [Vibrio cholerae]
MHVLTFLTGAVMLAFHHLIESNQILNTFGWCGIIYGVLIWWEKKIILEVTNPKSAEDKLKPTQPSEPLTWNKILSEITEGAMIMFTGSLRKVLTAALLFISIFSFVSFIFHGGSLTEHIAGGTVAVGVVVLLANLRKKHFNIDSE